MKRKRFIHFFTARRIKLHKGLIVIVKNRFLIHRLKKNIARRYRPKVSTVLWWDWDYENMDFYKAPISVIGRIIEYGSKKDFDEMVRFYGLNFVLQTLKYDIKFLADYAIERACNYFSHQKEEIWCYIDKQSRPNYWI